MAAAMRVCYVHEDHRPHEGATRVSAQLAAMSPGTGYRTRLHVLRCLVVGSMARWRADHGEEWCLVLGCIREKLKSSVGQPVGKVVSGIVIPVLLCYTVVGYGVTVVL